MRKQGTKNQKRVRNSQLKKPKKRKEQSDLIKEQLKKIKPKSWLPK